MGMCGPSNGWAGFYKMYSNSEITSDDFCSKMCDQDSSCRMFGMNHWYKTSKSTDNGCFLAKEEYSGNMAGINWGTCYKKKDSCSSSKMPERNDDRMQFDCFEAFEGFCKVTDPQTSYRGIQAAQVVSDNFCAEDCLNDSRCQMFAQNIKYRDMNPTEYVCGSTIESFTGIYPGTEDFVTCYKKV